MGRWFPWVVKLNHWEEDYLSDSSPAGEILQYFLFEPNRHEYFLPGQVTENLQFADSFRGAINPLPNISDVYGDKLQGEVIDNVGDDDGNPYDGCQGQLDLEWLWP